MKISAFDMTKFLPMVLARNATNAERMDALLEEYTKTTDEGKFELFAAVSKELLIGRDIERARKAAILDGIAE